MRLQHYSMYKNPKNHGISKLVVWRSQTPAIHIQTPLYQGPVILREDEKMWWALLIFLGCLDCGDPCPVLPNYGHLHFDDKTTRQLLPAQQIIHNIWCM